MSANATRNTLVGILLVAVVAFGGYWLVTRTARVECAVCRRDIPSRSKAVIELNGKREALCCVRCGLTGARQRGQGFRLLEVTDYVSLRPLRPEGAYYVEGSRIVLCSKHEHRLDPSKHPEIPVFDRCEPSIFAFARRQDAEAFAAANGGAVRGLSEILRESARQP